MSRNGMEWGIPRKNVHPRVGMRRVRVRRAARNNAAISSHVGWSWRVATLLAGELTIPFRIASLDSNWVIMSRFGKTSQNSLLRKHIGAVARASCQVSAQRISQCLAPGATSGSSLGGRNSDPCPTWAGRILLWYHPQLLSACLPPSVFPKTPVTRIYKC